jgi:hypothetical protein
LATSTTRVVAHVISAAAVCALLSPAPASAAALTDLTVFSTNSTGHNYYSLIWNTQGLPDNRFNVYLSTSADFTNPTFINGGNDASTNINVDLAPGTYYFTLFGESAFTPVPSDVHFVTNLYFDGDQSAPGISGLSGAACPAVCAAGNPMGLNITGTAVQPEAGTLSWADGVVNVALTEFTWITDRRDIDEVWAYWANQAPYNNGSGTPDFFGTLRLDVTSVPEPGTTLLFLAGLAAAAGRLRRRE